MANCQRCKEIEQEFAHLDALLGSGPAPEAPLDLTAAVLRAVGERRLREAARIRTQVAAVLVAAILVLVGGLVAQPWLEGTSLLGELEFASTIWTYGQDTLAQWRANLDDAFSMSLTAEAPAGLPLLALILVLPSLLVLNWSISRGLRTQRGSQ